MAVMSLSALQKMGQFVSADMFGANAVFSETNAGVPTGAYGDAAQALGIQNIRFGGGQSDLDPTKANAAGITPIDGETAINIVDMPGGALRPELVNFLDWCVAKTAAGEPVQATLILPTKHLTAEEYEGFTPEIETFVQTVMQQYGDVIGAFQMGNEYWEMGETAYGIKASLGAVAISNGLAAAGVPEPAQPDILVQMGTAGNAGSEFPAVPGISDFAARNKAANNKIIEQLSDEAKSVIDGVTEHYYYNKTDYAFLSAEAAVKNINRDYDVWSGHFGDDLDLHITEWNVKTTATEQHGIVAASTLIKQFENMIEIGVDGAHIWALDYHSRTALTLDTDEGAKLDGQGRLINSAQGAVFDLMSDALVGKELVSASFTDGVPGIEVTTYAYAGEMVFYISSRSFETTSFTLDLDSKLPNIGTISGVKVSMDLASSNGKQWQNGADAESVLIDGTPYFYNEHDVDVVLTDMQFTDASQIDLTFNPFEVVELKVSLLDTIPDNSSTVPPLDMLPDAPAQGPVTPDSQMFIGTDGNDMIMLTDSVTQIDGAAGLDSVFVEEIREDAVLTPGAEGMASLMVSDSSHAVSLTSIERLEFADGTLALDIDGNSGQAYRLYKASFDREPDLPGLKYWIGQLDTSISLLDAARYFLNSVEFEETYGRNATLTDAEFIDLLYANVLDRVPDQEGYDFWRGQQQNNLSREDILISFSESVENKANVAPAIDDGIWFA